MTAREAWLHAHHRLAEAGVANARLDAELLLRHVTGWSRAEWLTRGEQTMDNASLAQFEQSVARRLMHEPVQYITGVQEFYGREFRVTPAVLIPRPETELLIDSALHRLSVTGNAFIADIGTGSGAIAVTICAERPNTPVVATDCSAAALAVARENAERHHVADRCDFALADLLPPGTEDFDLIAANPPYVAEAERGTLAREVRDYEPSLALFAQDDGLAAYKRIIPLAKDRLRAGGWLLLELGAGQEKAVCELLAGWRDVSVAPDLQGIPRVLSARTG